MTGTKERSGRRRWAEGRGPSRLVAVLACATFAVAGAAEGSLEFRLASPAFEPGQEIPVRFTCEGEDVSPELRWTAPPEGARSLVLVVDDPDAPDPKAPRVVWVHWLVAGLPASAGGLPEDVGAALPGGAVSGRNGWERSGWGGPCPPVGRHRYFFRLHALDEAPELDPGFSRDALERAVQGHVLATAELMGTYEKQGR